MTRKRKFFLAMTGLVLTLITGAHAQTTCDPSDIVGDNLVVNGGFESGDQDFTTTISCSWNDPACSCHNNSFSQPDEYYVGGSPSEASACGGTFQSGFVGSPHSGTKFLMVDGQGSASPTVWQQDVMVEANTYYFFQVYVATIGTSPATVAKLQFEIAGTLQDTIIDAPASTNVWEDYTQIWYSGATTGLITIKIRDVQPASAGPDEDDFGLDDIVFQKGCPPEAFDQQPELGDDATFCGTDGTITLDPGLTIAANNDIWWSTGTNDGDTTIDVTIADTYYVCFSTDGTCTKIDSITLADDYTIGLGNDVNLCAPSSDTLNAGHRGKNVTYQWYKDGAAITLGTKRKQFINASGEYVVVVDDPSCDIQRDTVNVDISGTQPEPGNVDFCLTMNADTTIEFTVTPAGVNYDWYEALTGGSVLAGGTGTDSYSRSGIVVGDTLYAKDKTISTFPVTGPTNTAANGPGWGLGANDFNRSFEALSDLTILEVDIETQEFQGPCNGKGSGVASDNVVISLYQNGAPTGQSVTTTVTCHTIASVPLNFVVPEGDNYELRIPGGHGFYHKNDLETESFTISDVLEIKTTDGGTGNSGAFFNWDIEAESTCDRVPVLARDVCVLPVEFLHFTVSDRGSGALLNWATTTEVNNSHFEIERSTDGINFTVIGTVAGSGNSSEVVFYNFVDNHVPAGVVYYRLRQVDYDGKYDYSDIQAIRSDEAVVMVYPNPFSVNAFLFISSTVEKAFSVELIGVDGKFIQAFQVVSNTQVELPAYLASGVYILRVIDNETVYSLKVVKE